jgi:hypothetical protein
MLAVFTNSFLTQSVYLIPTGGTSNDFELSAPAPGGLLLYPKAMAIQSRSQLESQLGLRVARTLESQCISLSRQWI